MSKPRLLDLFCGAGGAAMGYSRNGFEVVGVDIKPQPHYPFEFRQADALTYPLEGFDAFHASPPCQGYSIMNNLPWLRGKDYPLLLPLVIQRLETTNKPYVVENVMGARNGAKCLSRRGLDGLKAGYLCGQMFGLPFYRHRLFATNWLWLAPGHLKHLVALRRGHQFGPNGGRLRDILPLSNNVGTMTLTHAPKSRVKQAAIAMGVDWMHGDEVSQAIPPAYTEFIGKYLMQVVRGDQGQVKIVVKER